ncbi:MAG: hypothetical protein D6796_07015 [Caldilineae bacterium]|nr:MAG: hypothetical protein D6796_07015 [Caldilineae bacterium]
MRYEYAGYFKDVQLSELLGHFGKKTLLYICAGYSQDRFLVSDRPCHENGTKGWVNKRFLKEIGLPGFSFADFPAQLVTPGPTLSPTPTPAGGS